MDGSTKGITLGSAMFQPGPDHAAAPLRTGSSMIFGQTNNHGTCNGYNVLNPMPFAPSPSYHHFYGVYKAFPNASDEKAIG